MRVIFKNVGLGDSIILEWISNNEKKYGIIDCHKTGDKNPTLEFIQAINPDKIEFVILTHFHFDHYSGFPELFDFILQKRISIKNFYHTLSGTITQIAQTETNGYNSNNKRNIAHSFLTKFDMCRKQGIIEETLRLDNKRNPIQLYDNVSIKIYAPLDSDHMKVETEIGRYLGKHTKKSPDVNKLSTILKIENGGEYILLTSDATKSAMNRIERVVKGKMILSQVPHHGSKLNHSLKFWSNKKVNLDQIAVISVGYDLKNKLPNKETVHDLRELGYKVHSTNQVFGLSNVFGKPNNLNQVDLPEVDLGSLLELDEEESFVVTNLYDNLNGDQILNFW